MQFEIAPAAPADVPALLEMIRELARFEKLEHEVEATVECLTDSFFGPRPVAGAFLARSGGEPAGYALYYFTFCSFLGRRGIWLDDLYVRPAFRHQGLGRALIETVARVGAGQHCGRFEWTALKWNINALEFYRKLGAQTLDDWVTLRLNASELQRLANREKT
jgi:GNAT superfamily N-acetyltransferase